MNVILNPEGTGPNGEDPVISIGATGSDQTLISPKLFGIAPSQKHHSES